MNKKHARLLAAMVEYDKGDVPRIQHFIKVHDFAAAIAKMEDVDEETLFILETAAILHDIGIHASEEKYGDCNGKHQEELDLARHGACLTIWGAIQRNRLSGCAFLLPTITRIKT